MKIDEGVYGKIHAKVRQMLNSKAKIGLNQCGLQGSSKKVSINCYLCATQTASALVLVSPLVLCFSLILLLLVAGKTKMNCNQDALFGHVFQLLQ